MQEAQAVISGDLVVGAIEGIKVSLEVGGPRRVKLDLRSIRRSRDEPEYVHFRVRVDRSGKPSEARRDIDRLGFRQRVRQIVGRSVRVRDEF